jgi:N-acetylglutamate synthase-like GNAT family acetyltransferase
MATLRKASPDDATAACDVLRRSIRELCARDHKNDENTISAWLENKTPENVRKWLTSTLAYGVVAERHGKVCGFAMVARNGSVTLCYVLPEVQHSGVGKKLLAEMEAQAVRWGLDTLTVESTLTAKLFYERNGYVAAGDPLTIWSQPSYPLQKLLAL